MKQDWGLNDVWNGVHFERLNSLTNSNDFGQWENKRSFQTTVPDTIAKGFLKKNRPSAPCMMP
jgi:CRISPR-associated endonuclease Csn1